MSDTLSVGLPCEGPALRSPDQARAHDLRAALRLRRRVPRRRRGAVGARPALDHRRDGRRPLARDGAEPADRRGDRRPQPEDGRPGDPVREADDRRRLAFSLALARRVPDRGLAAEPGRALALADPGRRCSSSTPTSSASRGSATSGSVRSTGSPPWAHGSRSPGRFRGRRGRSAEPSRPGSPGSTSSTRSSTSRSTGRRGSTPGRCASASVARSSVRAGCTSRPWRCSSPPGSASTSTGGTGPASSRSPVSSPTSTRWSARATCGASTRRSSR